MTPPCMRACARALLACIVSMLICVRVADASCFSCAAQIVYGFNGTKGENGTKGDKGDKGDPGEVFYANLTNTPVDVITVRVRIDGSPAITTPTIASLYGSTAGKLLSLPAVTANDTLVAASAAQTLTNKSIGGEVFPIATTSNMSITTPLVKMSLGKLDVANDYTSISATSAVAFTTPAITTSGTLGVTGALTAGSLSTASVTGVNATRAGAVVLSTPNLASGMYGAGSALVSLPDVGSTTDTLVAVSLAQTLSSKTLTTPVIASFYQSTAKTNLLTVPAVTAADTLVMVNAPQVLTNKNLTGATLVGVTTIATGGTINGATLVSPGVTGTLTVANGGTIAMGNSAAITASTTLSITAVAQASITAPVMSITSTTSLGVQSPSVSLSGTLNLAGTLTANNGIAGATLPVTTTTNVTITSPTVKVAATTLSASTQYTTIIASTSATVSAAAVILSASTMTVSATGSMGITSPSVTVTGALSASASLSTPMVMLQDNPFTWTISGLRTGLTIDMMVVKQNSVAFSLVQGTGWTATTAAGQQLLVLTMTGSAAIFPSAFALISGVSPYNYYTFSAGIDPTAYPVITLTQTLGAGYPLRTLTVTSGSSSISNWYSQWTVFYAGY